MAQLFFKLMTKITASIDPHLEKYRPQAAEPEPELFLPESNEELIALLRSCPADVLSDSERRLIAGAMAFPIMPIRSIMHGRKALSYLNEDDKLDPLTLDRLYKTGEHCFPVRATDQSLVGILRVDKLDALKVTEDSVAEHMTKELCYVRADYSYEMALASFVRTGNDFAFVIDRQEQVIGYITLADLMSCLLSVAEAETFCSDTNPTAVAIRRKR